MLDALEDWEPGADTKVRMVKSASNIQFSKVALGGKHSLPDEVEAKAMVNKAFALKKDGRLADAADALEEAFNKSPELRGKYSNQVKLWRCGISM